MPRENSIESLNTELDSKDSICENDFSLRELLYSCALKAPNVSLDEMIWM